MAKQRSPNYPAISLREAVETVQAIHDKEKKTQVSGEVMAKAMGYGGLSGPARAKISALKKYGLVEGDERRGIRVSDLAMRVLFAPNGVEALIPLREAALRPELFKMLYSSFRDGSDEAMRAHLITKLDFSPLGAKQVIAAFRDTYSFAGLNQMERTDSTRTDKNEAELSATETRMPDDVARTIRIRDHLIGDGQAAQSVSVWTWTLSMPRSVRAELRIFGDVKKGDVVRLKKQIDALEESFDDDNESA